ncbi:MULTISPECIES: hypothetical protein [unclassified Pseudescherichia]|uniref:hypothetical protein n=1 Tax=unclassified Pseudescherichia TaxID=2620545 RepID=UPI00214FB0D5|nr:MULTISPECIES: hypothetical protein [unclassified Pseudescherichia]MCR4456724.1 hypothetical protein [Pseudescherichia sp. L3]
MTNKLTAIDTPAAPRVLNASSDDNYTIDQYDIKSGLVLVIPDYTDAQPQDLVMVHWGDYQQEYQIADTDQLPLEIDVLNDYPPSNHEDGTYDVYYVVTDHLQNQRESDHISLIIDAGQYVATLPAPVVPDAAPGYINYNAALDGVAVDITYSPMTAGDVITLIMKGYDNAASLELADIEYTYIVTAIDARKGTVEIDKITLQDMQQIGENAYALFWYTVAPADGSAVETSETFRTEVDVVPPGGN